MGYWLLVPYFLKLCNKKQENSSLKTNAFVNNKYSEYRIQESARPLVAEAPSLLKGETS